MPSLRNAILLTIATTFLYFRIMRTLNFDNYMATYIYFLTCITLYAIYELNYKRRRLPNGPVPWLVAGNMPSFINVNNVDVLFQSWKQQYGGIFTVWIGPIPLVMVSDLPTIKKYFIQHADSFSNRWRNFVTDSIMEGSNGIVQIDGNKWREQRRFALHTLRDFGVGKPLMEQMITLEVTSLMNHMEKSCGLDGKELHLCPSIAVCVGNIINNMLFGLRFNQDNSYMHRLHQLLDDQSHTVMQPIMGAYIAFPVTSKIPIINGEWNRLMGIKNELLEFLETQIEGHRMNWKDEMIEQEPEDLTYAYMIEVEKRKRNGEDVGFFDDQQLKMLLLDLFFAGMETTVTTLKWAFLLMAKNQKVQKNVQAELDSIGQPMIEIQHRTRLPYVQATINEIQRIANILPINLLRTVAEDIEIDGYNFKKGDLIIPQISILMNDPEIFENPEEFNPSRFLDEDNNVKKIDEFLPFSIGRRQCLGESLARAELYLVFANLIQNFNFEVADDVTTERVLGLTVSPVEYSCKITRRGLDHNQNSVK
ncbi:CYtochrome P450 family [Caenorhabditis elegans]|uniref:CYtochrome P450 family n=1 Tax=Caenorhabditis elegans TaxID=6239 RepID=Q27465_CAEEL|nr:CYtochrome P450 family [Caenorhabditis elegans]CCD61735.1 CYtochrome P450 family [Caenorhabditis elegans]|eukprot:NP_494797.1 CYtochrome P450 family [Caenorhabditis elegans]